MNRSNQHRTKTKPQSRMQRWRRKSLSFLAGSFLVCLVALLKTMVFGPPLSTTDYAFFVLFGGMAGVAAEVLYSRRAARLVTINEQLEQEMETRQQTEEEKECLLAAERAQRLQAETLRRVAGILNSSLDREQVLQSILDQLAQVVDYDSASVMLLADGIFRVVADRGFRSEEQRHITLDIKALPRLQRMIQQRHPAIIADTTIDPHWVYLPENAYVRCWLGVPMVVQDRVIGILNLDSEQAGFYTPRDAELATAFASQAAIAIENARLYQQARHDAETKSVLLREVNHRVKNNLSAIIGLLYAERRRMGVGAQADSQAIIQSLINRVQSLSTVHSLLSATEWQPVTLDELALRVIRSSLEVLPSEKHMAVQIEPSPVRVTADQAHNLALAFNELTTNAVKYALAGRDQGSIAVHLSSAPDGWVSVEFSDDGPGYPTEVLEKPKESVGLDLLRKVVGKNLGGELTLHNAPHGARATIRFRAIVQEPDQ